MANEEFLSPLTPDESGFLTELGQTTEPPKGQITTKERTEDLKANTGLTEDELEGLMDSNAISLSPIETRELAPAGSKGVFESLLSGGGSLEEIEAAVQKKVEVDKALTGIEDLSSVSTIMAADPKVSARLFRSENRLETSRKALLDLSEEAEGGFASTVMDVIDQLGYDTYAGIRDIRGSLAGEGTEVSEISDMWEVAIKSFSDEEFEAFYKERLQHLTDTGPLWEDNASWRIMRELEAMESAGAVLWDEEMGVLFGLMSALDVATLGLSGVKTIGMAGRSVVGRLRNTSSISTATEAAVRNRIVHTPTLRESITPPHSIRKSITESEIVDDIVPSSVRTTIASKGQPVSVGSVSQAIVGNKFVKQFLLRQDNHSFGVVDLSQSAENWAQAQATRLSKASGTSVIDYDISLEGIQQAKAVFTMGKDSGLPFDTLEAANRMASKYPNSAVHAVPGSPLTGTQYTFKTTSRVPVRETVSPTDLSKVSSKTRIGRLLGRADLGSDTFFANLADAGDFGALGFQKDFEKVVKEVNKLPKRDRNTIDEILTTLRDTPTNGTSRTWLPRGEFSDAYRAKTGSYPSDEVIKAYEDLIEVSDFNWYVKANEQLATMANQKVTMVKVGSFNLKAFPSKRSVSGLKEEKGAVWVHSVATGQRVSVKDLSNEAPLLELSVPTSKGETFVTDFYGQTRVPELEDALAYNAGGPRSNPDMLWFVGNGEGNWATLIGARTQKESLKAVEQFNEVAGTVRSLGGVDNKSVNALKQSDKDQITAVLQKNNDWNPNLETADDFIGFTNSRGVPAYAGVVSKERGHRIKDFIQTNDESLVNLNLEAFISFHRHDQALLEYGGVKASNPSPILAINRQYNQMVTRGAQMQYRMHHPSAWVKAAQKSGLIGDIPLHPMTDELKVKTWEIKGSTVEANRLRQEQSVILRRLDMFEGSQSSLATEALGKGVSKATQWGADVAHNINPRAGAGARYLKGFADGMSDRLLSLGFFQKMGSIDNMFLQASHFIPITAVSPTNGARGLQIATVIRQAARTGDASAWNTLLNNMSVTTGIPKSELKLLSDHMLFSGRGYMRGAIAEDPLAGIGNSILGRTKDIISTPYYAGENFSATLSRVVAFLDIRKKYPATDPSSREFWSLVQTRDRDLSFALNKAQKSEIQTDGVTRVLTQWSSYQLRMVETTLFGESLTVAEKTRLGAMQLMLWGAAGLGLNETAMSIKENETFGMFSNAIAEGADAFFGPVAGIKIGDRLAFNPVELWDRGHNMVALNLEEAVPAYKITSDTGTAAYSLLTNSFTGRWGLLGHDVQTLGRAWKAVDSAMMAYTMNMENVRRTKSGSEIHKDFTPMQEVFQFIGVKPSESTDFSASSTIVFDQKKKKKMAIDTALPYFKRAVVKAQEKDYGAFISIMKDVDAIVAAHGLTDTRLIEVRETLLQRAGFNNVNWIAMEMIKDGYTNEAIRFKEKFQ